jgi:NAD(P)-dependent dehydrogenase (short-subunit alcohol dehydrogenase family)
MKKVVLITGGTDGLGKALARKLAASHTVIILGRDKEKASYVANEAGCFFVTADVTDYASLRQAAHEVKEQFHRIDRLVNNAGVWVEGPLLDTDPSLIGRAIDINTRGVMYSTRAFLPLMTAGGLVTNVIAEAGLVGRANQSVYTASKWAITGFTRSLELELAPLHIRVAGFYPGPFRTGLYEKAGAPRDMTHTLPVEEVAAHLAQIVEAPEHTVISGIVVHKAE